MLFFSLSIEMSTSKTDAKLSSIDSIQALPTPVFMVSNIGTGKCGL